MLGKFHSVRFPMGIRMFQRGIKRGAGCRDLQFHANSRPAVSLLTLRRGSPRVNQCKDISASRAASRSPFLLPAR